MFSIYQLCKYKVYCESENVYFFKINKRVFFVKNSLSPQNFFIVKKMDFKRDHEKKYLNNNSNIFCNKTHLMKKIDDYFILHSSDLMELFRHQKKYVQEYCDIVCPRNTPCSLHVKLQRLERYVDWLRENNLNSNVIIKKVAIYFNEDVARTKEAFWWCYILEWEEINAPPNATMSWRSQFL